MQAANRLLIQVVAQLKPERCGVSDHAISLARELEAGLGIKAAFVVVNSAEPCDLPYPRIYCAQPELLEACNSLSEGQSAALLVHLSGYGFSRDGAPVALAETLMRVRQEGRFPVAVYFHELYATGMPWRSAFWYTRKQQRAVRQIAEECDLVVTNTRLHADWLERVAVKRSEAPIQTLPVFSNLGASETIPPAALRKPALANFGLPGTRRRAYAQLRCLGNMLHSLGIEEILDVGPECDAPSKVAGIPVRRFGVLSAGKLADLLSHTMYGFVKHPSFCLAKSGVFAGLCAFGAIPVISQPFSGEVDGLRDGVQLVSPRTFGAVQAAGLEGCSVAAWQWHSGHTVNVHAGFYARSLFRTKTQPARN